MNFLGNVFAAAMWHRIWELALSNGLVVLSSHLSASGTRKASHMKATHVCPARNQDGNTKWYDSFYCARLPSTSTVQRIDKGGNSSPDAADVTVPKTATLRPHTELFEESVRHGRFQGNEPMTSCILQYPRPLKPVMWGSQYQLAKISKLQVLCFPSGCVSQPVCELGYTRRKTGVAKSLNVWSWITLARSPSRLGLDVQYLLKNKCG